MLSSHLSGSRPFALFFAFLAVALSGALLLLTGWSSDGNAAGALPPSSNNAPTAHADCPPGATDSLALPEGFCATVFHEGVGPARHLVVRSNGDVYVKLSSVDTVGASSGSVVALRDTNGDGQADRTERFGDFGGTGVALRDSMLYASSETAVMRWPLAQDQFVPSAGAPDTVVGGFPEQNQHAAKSFAFDGQGGLYVNVGAPSNACQEQSRTPGSPGQEPCPLLEGYAGIWKFDADQTGQSYQPEARYASGIRNAVALDWNEEAGALHAMQHGRDQLHSLWPDRYTQETSAELPSEEFFAVNEGDDFGWPYCYHDWQQGQKELAPEYGGSGEEVGRCADFEAPIEAFPGHWAPNDLLFYTASAFPERYQGGAFIAFHGSWNRAPFPQQGYRVSFVPFEGGEPSGDYTTFANGFARQDTLESPGNAAYRPMGLAQGPEGALYITDSVKGRIWRVTHP